MAPTELILSKLEGAEKGGKGYMAFCPAHPDGERAGRRSLSVFKGDDGAACVKCFAGCATDAILKAIGLEPKHLFPAKDGQSPKARKKEPLQKTHKNTHSYPYPDENGEILYWVDRWTPKNPSEDRSKTFTQRRKVAGETVLGLSQGWYFKDAKGRWHPLKGKGATDISDRPGEGAQWFAECRRVLYNLPAVLQAKGAGEEVWFCEGEKDVENVKKRGAVATTCVGGSCNWRPEFGEMLKGATVVLVRDQDKPGFKRVAVAYEALQAVGCFVRVVAPAEGKDASDHIFAGRGLDEFVDVDPHEKCLEPKKEQQAEAQTPEITVVDGGGGSQPAPSTAPAPIETRPRGGNGYYPADEHGNCRRLIDRFGKDIHWCPKFGAWLTWDGNRWVVDETEGAPLQAMAVLVVCDLERHLKKLEVGSKTWQAYLKYIQASASKRGINAMIDLAKREPGIAISPDQLDADDMLAGCPNGTLDLTTGELRTSRREDLITKQLGVSYDPDARCDGFGEFLSQALLGDSELYSYVWRAMGYSLTGSTKAECFFFAHGPGGGGKGTMFRVLKAVMGDYAKTLRAASLQAKNIDQIPQDIAKLKGARIAFVHETAENKRFDENLIKELTGGNEVTARFMRENEFEYLPKFKLWIAGNHKPDIISFDRSWSRRLRLIPFEHVVPEEQADEELKVRLATEQAPGVLAQMVRYCVKWQQDGMREGAAMRLALAQYREESDAVRRFLDEKCELDQFGDEGARASDLYKQFKLWAKEYGEYCGSVVWFGKDLAGKLFEKKRNKQGWYYPGITLLEPSDQTTTGDPKYDN
jgi:putative DNA primase/helicase